jgi:hypothetical protein
MATNGNGDAAKHEPSRRIIPSNCKVNVVCLPAHDEADEMVNLMLVQLLELRGYCAFSVSQSALASEMIEQIDKRHADVVIVSALPPGAVAHARYLCKRVHGKFPDMVMAVGLWGTKGDLEKARRRIACSEKVPVVSTLAQMQREIDQLAQPIIVRNGAAT